MNYVAHSKICCILFEYPRKTRKSVRCAQSLLSAAIFRVKEVPPHFIGFLEYGLYKKEVSIYIYDTETYVCLHKIESKSKLISTSRVLHLL